MQQQDLVIYAIATIILVGSWVVNILRKQAEEREQQGESAGEGEQSTKGRLDELAARRREELRALARERRGETQARPGTSASTGEPANMSMAERIARARAKAQYEQRTQQLGGAPAQTRPQGQAPRRPEPVAADPSGRQTEMERARQRDIQRREAERRQRQEAERRARAEKERLTRQRQLERQRAEQAAERRRREADEAARQRSSQSGSASRTRERQSAYAPAAVSGDRRPLPFTKRSLREAVVLREVFDRPLAMRDPIADRVF